MRTPYFLFLSFILSSSTSNIHAQLVNIESRRMQTDTLRFAGNVNLTFNHRRTNDVTLSVFKSSLTTQFKSKNLKHIFLVLGNYAFTQSNTATLANAAFGHVRYNYKYKDWLRWEAYTQLQLNELLSLKYRFLSGAGARFKLTHGEIFKAYIGVSAFYEHEVVEDVLQTESRDIRASNYFSFSIKFPKKRGEFVSTTYYQPLINFWADYRITTQSLVQLNITQHLSFITSVNYFFDYKPPVGVKPSTFSINNGLRIRF
ncbi:MAG: DUF481 domain-containing protein [Crocinitomicaceae bacterium]